MTVLTANWHDGVPAAVDRVADSLDDRHSFLCRAWFDAAVHGDTNTVVVEDSDRELLALPLVPAGPIALRMGQVAGGYWPFRTFALAKDAPPGAIDAGLHAAFERYRAIRIGPVYGDDPTVTAVRSAARAAGCAVLRRRVAQGWLFDLGDRHRSGGYPRSSTLKKIRYYEKQLATVGPLSWETLGAADWPAGFDLLGRIERASWITERTDGRDAKFIAGRHRRLWDDAVRDPVLSRMLQAKVLRVGGEPVAFSFELRAGSTSHVIANSYDRRFARFSPGKLLTTRHFADLATEGVETIDWGAGDSGYKQAMGARRGAVFIDLVVVRPGMLSWLVSRLSPSAASRASWTCDA